MFIMYKMIELANKIQHLRIIVVTASVVGIGVHSQQPSAVVEGMSP